LPELPEVEVLRLGLVPHLEGRRIDTVTCAVPALRYPLPDNLNDILAGQHFRGIDRRAKYLLFHFDHDCLLVWHLGMTGQFHLLPGEAQAGPHEHVCFHLNDGQSLRYRDARRFGYAGLIPVKQMPVHPWFKHLGPEPLSDGFNSSYLVRACFGRRAAIKNLIMDSRIVVGVGNIYASEALFRAGIHPARAAGRIATARTDVLVNAIRQVLSEAIRAGGSSIRDFVHVDGKPGYFTHCFAVYGRRGEPCHRCGRSIRRLVLAGRSSFYCPHCQH